MIVIKRLELLRHLESNKKTFYGRRKYDIKTIFHVFLPKLKKDNQNSFTYHI